MFVWASHSVCYTVQCVLQGEADRDAALYCDSSEVAVCYTPTSPNTTY